MVRNIEAKMVQYLDEKLKNNGLAKLAIKNKDARTLMLEAAKVCVGIREKTGKNDGPMVKLIQETIGDANGEAWCMAFIMTCIAYAEKKTGVKSPIVASEHCMTTWNTTPKKQRVKYHPLAGAIAIWQHGTSQSGHTGFVISCDDKIFQAVEGNTNSGEDPKGEVVREGGGVYFTKRNKVKTGNMKVVGFLKPF